MAVLTEDAKKLCLTNRNFLFVFFQRTVFHSYSLVSLPILILHPRALTLALLHSHMGNKNGILLNLVCCGIKLPLDVGQVVLS